MWCWGEAGWGRRRDDGRVGVWLRRRFRETCGPSSCEALVIVKLEVSLGQVRARGAVGRFVEGWQGRGGHGCDCPTDCWC